jgi:hypothetical protein
MYKKTALILVLFLSSASYALKFSYDNYSDITGLKYSFTFNGQDWITPDVFGANSPAILNRHKLSDVRFAQLPKAWKIEAPDKTKFHCWDKSDEQKTFNNILTLNNIKFAHKNGLLLDVVDNDVGVSMHITDIDGNGVYSNTIICSIEPTENTVNL